jgi:hypothetical protein
LRQPISDGVSPGCARGLEVNNKVRFAKIDRRTSALRLKPEPINFTRAWPDGWQGNAMPHGAVFSNPK